jgi:VanZ family protein
MKLNKRSIMFIILTILWICVIFSFSMQNGEVSSQLSGGIVEKLVEWICPDGFEHTDLLETLIRKGAHFTEYFILGVLLSVTVREAKGSRPVLLLWELGTVVACCDETIQLFSDGRAGQITDVMLDSSGVLVGCVALYVLIRVKSKR